MNDLHQLFDDPFSGPAAVVASCQACAGQPGLHTCEQSGLHAAVEAHQAGAVAPVAPVRGWSVYLGLFVTGEPWEVRELVAAIEGQLILHPQIREAGSTVEERL